MLQGIEFTLYIRALAARVSLKLSDISICAFERPRFASNSKREISFEELERERVFLSEFWSSGGYFARKFIDDGGHGREESVRWFFHTKIAEFLDFPPLVLKLLR